MLEEEQQRNAKIRALDACVGSDLFELENTTATRPFTEWEQNFIGHVKDLVDRYKSPMSENQKRKVDEIWDAHAEEFELTWEDYVDSEA